MKNIWLVILALVVVGGAAWYFNKNFLDKTSPNLSPATPTQTDVSGMKLTAEKLIVENTSGQVKVINDITTAGIINKLFSDESIKISKIGTLAIKTREVPIITPDGSLTAVKLDGSGKTETLIKSLGTPSDFALSADGKSVCFVSYSNAERNIGYSLNVANRTGENLSDLVRIEQAITDPVWIADGKSIYYLQDNPDNTAIMKIALADGKAQEIYTTEDNIYSLGISSEKIIFSQGVEGEIQSAIYTIEGTEDPKQILTENAIIYYPTISGDSINIAYLTSGEATDAPAGDIIVASADGQTKKVLTKGIKILGFLP